MIILYKYQYGNRRRNILDPVIQGYFTFPNLRMNNFELHDQNTVLDCPPESVKLPDVALLTI